MNLMMSSDLKHTFDGIKDDKTLLLCFGCGLCIQASEEVEKKGVVKQDPCKQSEQSNENPAVICRGVIRARSLST